MKKLALLIAAIIILPGCSTLADVEGTGRFGEVMRTIQRTDSVLTGRRNDSPTAGKINRFNNQLRNTRLNLKGGTIPAIARDFKELVRYLK